MASIKIEYGASAAMTITLASLATSSTLQAGQESTAVDNTTNKYIDYIVAGKITTGTTPTVSKSIVVYVYGSNNDTPLYADVLDGADSAETFTTVDIRNSSVILAASMTVDATTARTYWFRPFSVANCFGGIVPKFWGIWVSHDTAVNLNSTGSNHAIYYTPVYSTVA